MLAAIGESYQVFPVIDPVSLLNQVQGVGSGSDGCEETAGDRVFVPWNSWSHATDSIAFCREVPRILRPMRPGRCLARERLECGSQQMRVTFCVAAVFTPELEDYSESLRLISEIPPEWRRQHDGKYS